MGVKSLKDMRFGMRIAVQSHYGHYFTASADNRSEKRE
jgi:hypothetical protein